MTFYFACQCATLYVIYYSRSPALTNLMHGQVPATIPLFAPDLVWQDVGDLLDSNYLQTVRAGGRERERERLALAYDKKYHVLVWNRYLEMLLVHIGFCTTSRIFDSIDALHAFYLMPKCLNWRNILSWIPFGSYVDPISDNVFSSFFLREKGSKYHWKQAIIGPASETSLNGISLACRWWPNVECWLGSFENFRGSVPVLLWNSIFLWFFRGRGGGKGIWTLHPPSGSAHGTGQCTLVVIYWKPIWSCFNGFCMTLCILSIACTNF